MTAEQPAREPPDVITVKRTTEEKISDAEAVLNRTIGFIENSESKTGIALTMVGIMMTVIFAMAGNDVMSMFSAIRHNLDAAGILFILLFFLSLTASVYGMCQFARVLVPSLECEKDSRIYFGKISDNRDYEEYRSKMEKYGPEDHLDDLWSQIYVNSKICIRKYRYFKHGLRTTVPGMFAVLAVIVIFRFLILG